MKKHQVYFIECAGRIKIGFSSDVSSRLRSLSTGSALKFSLIGVVDGSRSLEKALHKLLAEYRRQGEWFEDCPRVRNTISALIEGGPSAIGVAARIAQSEMLPTRREHTFKHSVGSERPLLPALVRIEACMQRHLGDGAAFDAEKKQALAARSFLMANEALNRVEALLDSQQAARLSGGRGLSLDDLLPEVSRMAGVLERQIETLFTSNPTKSR